VLNGQVFSVNDLIAVMRRHGIRIRLNRDGLSIDGEQITSISNLDGNKCPLAKSCDKLSALMDFLKLQKSQEFRERVYEHRDSIEPPYIQDSQQDYRDEYRDEYREDYRRDKQKRSDFIKPNNHDLFEGNVSNSRGLFDEPTPQETPSQVKGLFDDPTYGNDKDNSLFENSIFRQGDYDESDYSQDNQYQDRMYRDDSRVQDQLFCQKCGFDLDSNWNTCPRCGQRIVQNNKQKTYDTLF
jgi:hypothetical protein